MRLNADGTSSVVLGLVHAACVTQTLTAYHNLFSNRKTDSFGRPTHTPVDLIPQAFCSVCQKPFAPADRVALQGICA